MRIDKKEKENQISNAYLEKPDNIHISITARCDFHCRHCDFHKKPWKDDEPSCEEWKKPIKALYDWLGSYRVDFAGGEPLLKKGIIDLISYASSFGIFTVMTTNGHLIDQETAKMLVHSGIRSINISLESLCPETHNYIRGYPQAYERAMNAFFYLDRLRDREKLNLTVATVLMKPNLNHIIDLADWADRNGFLFNLQALYQNFGAEYDPFWYKSSPLWIDDLTQLDYVLNELIKRKSEGKMINNSIEHLELLKQYFRSPHKKTIPVCYVGDRTMAITEKGDVSLCFFTAPVGNIFKENPKDIWGGMEAIKRRKEMRSCKRNCDLLNCNYQRHKIS